MGSYCGVFFTFVMVILIVIYGLAKFTTLLERPKSAMKVQTSTEREAFDANKEFKSSDGFQIAAALTQIDGSGSALPDPGIVSLDFSYLIYEQDSTGEFKVSSETIPSHQCTDAELGIGQKSTVGFYPTEKNSKKPLEFHKQKFYCPDTTDLSIRGALDGNSAKFLGISVSYCNFNAHSNCIDPDSA